MLSQWITHWARFAEKGWEMTAEEIRKLTIDEDPRFWLSEQLEAHFAGWSDAQLKARYDALCDHTPAPTQPPGNRQTGPEWEAWDREVTPIGKELHRRWLARRYRNW